MDLNDYDKTDMDYNNLVTGKDCQEKWHMAPGLDPLLVEEGERFLATKSTMPKGSKPNKIIRRGPAQSVRNPPAALETT